MLQHFLSSIHATAFSPKHVNYVGVSKTRTKAVYTDPLSEEQFILLQTGQTTRCLFLFKEELEVPLIRAAALLIVPVWWLRTCMVTTYLYGDYVPVWWLRTYMYMVTTYLYGDYVPVWWLRTYMVTTYLYGDYVPVWWLRTCMVTRYMYSD